MRLLERDKNYVVSRIPRDIRHLMDNNPQLYVAGGFIRSVIAGEKINDIDLFGASKEHLELLANSLATSRKGRVHTTDNAMTVLSPGRVSPQFITRWLFMRPEDLAKSFDFTVCQAVVWRMEGKWYSLCSDSFYADLAARRLVYTHPIRNEEAGGSMLRVKKYLQRGYDIRVDSLAGVIARLTRGIFIPKSDDKDALVDRMTEENLARFINNLLIEVDPMVDIEEF